MRAVPGTLMLTSHENKDQIVLEAELPGSESRRFDLTDRKQRDHPPR